MRNRITISIIVSLTLSIINGCETIPSLTTRPPSEITTTTAISGGIVNADGGGIESYGVCWSTNHLPTVEDKISRGSNGRLFSCDITDLAPNTLYYLRAFAKNNAGTAYGDELSFTTQPVNGTEVIDIVGNIYHTLNVGFQVWLVENLKTTKFRNGESINNLSASDNSSLSSYSIYNFDSDYSNYGNLYNLNAVQDLREISPEGWHVPSKQEWEILVEYLGGEPVAGGKLKEVGSSHWATGNIATNESGFTALPGGEYLYTFKRFQSLRMNGFWWTSTNPQLGNRFVFGLKDYGPDSFFITFFDGDFFSVRCIRD